MGHQQARGFVVACHYVLWFAMLCSFCHFLKSKINCTKLFLLGILLLHYLLSGGLQIVFVRKFQLGYSSLLQSYCVICKHYFGSTSYEVCFCTLVTMSYE